LKSALAVVLLQFHTGRGRLVSVQFWGKTWFRSVSLVWPASKPAADV